MRSLKSIITLCILVLVSFMAGAQELKGYVKLLDNDSALASAFIENKTTRASTSSSSKGFYNMTARPGDRLRISLLGFETKEITLGETGSGSFTIYLKKQVNELDEVLVESLSAYQRDSIKRAKQYEALLKREPVVVRNDTQQANLIRRSFSGPGSYYSWAFPGFLSKKLEKRVGRAKRIFRQKEQFLAWEREAFVESIYTKDLVRELTSLEGPDCRDFINYYPMDYRFARTANKIELRSWIKANYRDWISKDKPVLIK